MTTPFRLRDPRQLLALGLGAGLVPRAPGTAGSLVALPLPWLLAPLETPAYLLVVAAAFAVGCWLCGAAARAVGVHDHPAIVWDEITGILVTFIAVPMNGWTLAAGFLLFRLFDILKPWPISVLDRRLTGGLGIMLDDAVAGLGALAVLHGLIGLADHIV